MIQSSKQKYGVGLVFAHMRAQHDMKESGELELKENRWQIKPREQYVGRGGRGLSCQDNWGLHYPRMGE